MTTSPKPKPSAGSKIPPAPSGGKPPKSSGVPSRGEVTNQRPPQELHVSPPGTTPIRPAKWKD